jgi:hypothetical protein
MTLTELADSMPDVAELCLQPRRRLRALMELARRQQESGRKGQAGTSALSSDWQNHVAGNREESHEG